MANILRHTMHLLRKTLFLSILFLIQYSYCRSFDGKAREKININREWKFKLGDYHEAKNENFNENGWSNVNLPHNFSIPYFQSAQWYTGYGWYRKHFIITEKWKNKQIFVEFEAAFREAEIYINGQLAGVHSSGYTGFSFDITDFVKTGKNVLSVRLNNNWNARLAPRNGDHNFTGGIYRDVYLVVTNKVHVNWYGTYITTPNLTKESGVVNIQTEIKNDGISSKTYTVKTDILDSSDKVVATVLSRQNILPDSIVTFNQTTLPIKEPKLWHPKHPFMYKAVSRVLDGKTLLDKYETKFGFRWMKWSADSGFFLNGEHYYFKGANVHQDHAGWASAVTNTAIKRDVQMVKDCGMDFIRGSHYPHDPAFSEACDELGVLLWQENDFWGSGGNQRETDNWYSGAGAYPIKKEDQPFFEENVKSSLREMIRIHRNHPSNIVWSMCNEPFFTGEGTIEKVRAFLKELTQLSHNLDPTRSVGIGGCQRGDIDKLGDIAGYNGDGARLFINPNIPNVVTEYGSTIAKRPGNYAPGWGDLSKQRDTVFSWRSGEALWCAFDYGTRAGDFGLMGMVDYFRMPKSQWYWYRNEYMGIPPPETAEEGTAAELKLTADKLEIGKTDGTDDIKLMVAVLGKEGKALSNSPDVSLEIISGPGEFPTGRSITFSKDSDIYIRDGKAAIEFRSYYSGKTIIKAISEGLKADYITIETKGENRYIEGVTPKVIDRPYTRYTISEPALDKIASSIAGFKPTRASSEFNGRTANFANDNDPITGWQSDSIDIDKWWQVDLENIYNVSEVKLLIQPVEAPYKIELSNDALIWEKIGESDMSKSFDLQKKHQIKSNAKCRFLRITFIGKKNDTVLLNEVEIFGKSMADMQIRER